MLTFPTNPTTNQVWPLPAIPGTPQWQFDGTKWKGFEGGLPEAPMDGLLYGRRSGNWSSVDIPDIPDGVLARTQVRHSAEQSNLTPNTWLNLNFNQIIRDDYDEWEPPSTWRASKSGIVLVQAYSKMSINGNGRWGLSVGDAATFLASGFWFYSTVEGSGGGGLPNTTSQICGVGVVSPGAIIRAGLYQLLTPSPSNAQSVNAEMIIVWL